MGRSGSTFYIYILIYKSGSAARATCSSNQPAAREMPWVRSAFSVASCLPPTYHAGSRLVILGAGCPWN
eukprot:5358850-Prymnesium_polylepis.1